MGWWNGDFDEEELKPTQKKCEKCGEATSLRNCLKYYKMIIDKFDIPQPTQEEVDKMIDVADADLDNFVASRTQV